MHVYEIRFQKSEGIKAIRVGFEDGFWSVYMESSGWMEMEIRMNLDEARQSRWTDILHAALAFGQECFEAGYNGDFAWFDAGRYDNLMLAGS